MRTAAEDGDGIPRASAPAAALDPTAEPTHVDGDARRALALLIGTISTVLFVALRLVVALSSQTPLAIDVWWHEFIRSGRPDILVVLAWIPGWVGGTLGVIVIALALITAFLVRRRRADAATLAAAIAVVVAVGAPMAAVIARVRPTDSLAESVATSFPSGHTAVAATMAVTLGLLLRRAWIWVAGAAWVVLMMWSRTYLSAHWLSDVVAGLLEGVAVACLVWCAAEALRDRRIRREQRLENT